MPARPSLPRSGLDPSRGRHPRAHLEVDLYLHVRVLISIILGLSVTRLLGGVAYEVVYICRQYFSLL